VTREEFEKRMDKVAREYHETHNPEIPAEIYNEPASSRIGPPSFRGFNIWQRNSGKVFQSRVGESGKLGN
jgi:hypothetical protein